MCVCRCPQEGNNFLKVGEAEQALSCYRSALELLGQALSL